MKRLIVVFLVMLAVFAFVSCKNTDPKTTESSTQNAVSDEFRIITPYCELCLPTELKGIVSYEIVAETPYKIIFRVTEDSTELYSITFNGNTGDLLGTVIAEGENTLVHASFAELDPMSENYEDYRVYQDSINTILTHLGNEYEFISGVAVGDNTSDTFDIPTSFTILKYPAKWKDLIEIQNAENAIYFTYHNVKIFDLYFTECEGTLLGFYGEIPIYVVSYTLESATLSLEEYNIACEMQEDINVILQNLLLDDKFI